MECKSNICWDCARACGGCLWSAFFKPVPGWTAEPTIVSYSKGQRGVKTYHITACPQFAPDNPKEHRAKLAARLVKEFAL